MVISDGACVDIPLFSASSVPFCGLRGGVICFLRAIPILEGTCCWDSSRGFCSVSPPDEMLLVFVFAECPFLLSGVLFGTCRYCLLATVPRAGWFLVSYCFAVRRLCSWFFVFVLGLDVVLLFVLRPFIALDVPIGKCYRRSDPLVAISVILYLSLADGVGL